MRDNIKAKKPRRERHETSGDVVYRDVVAGTEGNYCFALSELPVGFQLATAFIVHRIIKVLSDIKFACGLPVQCFTIGKSSIHQHSTVDADEFDPLNRHHLDVRHASNRWRQTYSPANYGGLVVLVTVLKEGVDPAFFRGRLDLQDYTVGIERSSMSLH